MNAEKYLAKLSNVLKSFKIAYFQKGTVTDEVKKRVSSGASSYV